MKIPWNKAVTSAAMPLLLGVAAFFLIVGPRALRPSNIAWLASGDPSTHYLGWHFFRNADWSFPIGLNPDYGLELSSSIVFSDSIPLLALLFKPFSSLLPETFQYFGLWLLVCFVLQAWLAWKLIGLISRHPAIRLLGAGLFVFAPSMLLHVPEQYALSAQFLILAALYLSLRPTQHMRIAFWALVLVVAALVHPYILAMVAALWLADSTQALVRRERSAKSSAPELVGIPAMVGLACWQAGYFTVGTGVSAAGYGHFRMNLLSILDADGWSYVLQDLRETYGEREGFNNYLGLGVIVLTLFALPALIHGRTGLPAAIKQRAILLGALVALFLFALSHKIGIGPLQIELPLAKPLLQAANVFRVSERMFWPVLYASVLTLIFIVVHGNRPRTAISLLTIALALQVIDTSAGWQIIRKRLMVKPATEWPTPLKDPFWIQAAARYRKVRWLPTPDRPPHWKTFAAYAGRHGLGTDAAYLARINRRALEIARKNASSILDTGRYEADSLYMLSPANSAILKSAALHIDSETDLLARIDGFYLVAPGWKRCRECGHLDRELGPADASLMVGTGERIRFSESGSGMTYLIKGWAYPEAWGTWSNGPAAEVVLPVSDDDIREILIEATMRVSPARPKQDIEILVSGMMATSVCLTASAANRIRVPIPEAARGKLRKYGGLWLEFRFPGAVRPKALRINDDPHRPALGLLAITLL